LKKKGTVKEKGHSRWREKMAKRCRKGETAGSTEAGTNETGKEIDRKKIMKSEKLKESELQTAKTPYDKKKQTKDSRIPSNYKRLLKVAKIKMENPMGQHELCSNK